MTTVALLGLGEVGRIAYEDLTAARSADAPAGAPPLTVVGIWDTAFADPDSPASRNARELAVTPATSAAAAVGDADLVISAVTAARCVDAARAAASALAPGAWFFDLNSASPGHKRQAAALVDGAGGRYVEAALMSPIGPRRLASPFLLGGPHAHAFAAVAAGLRLTGVSVADGELGRAAATKLCRSVIVKGLEALLTESLLSARRLGVERDVLDSLPNILPPADWDKVAAYFISRSVEHGARRAEEMTEAAATVTEAGIDPWMSTACVRRQQWAAGHRKGLGANRSGDASPELVELLDHILTGLPALPSLPAPAAASPADEGTSA